MKSQVDIDLPEIMTIDELCKYLDCSSTIGYSIVKKRGFPAIKVAGKWIILKNKFIDWLNKQSDNKK